MIPSCTELLEELRERATFGKLRAFLSGDIGQGSDKTYEHIGAVGNGSRAHLTVLAVNHFAACVKALEAEHGAHWKEEPLPGHEDYVINSSCEEGECHVCKLLAELRRALEDALR